MAEKRLIDANALYDDIKSELKGHNPELLGSRIITLFLDIIAGYPDIDPETLPIVQELREKLEQVTEERGKIKKQVGNVTMSEFYDCEKIAKDLLGCKTDCSKCEYRGADEFDCTLCARASQTILLLVKQLKKLKAEHKDILEILHSYRHICHGLTPQELEEIIKKSRRE